MDIGTAKPSSSELQAAKHHLVDVLELDETCTASWFIEKANGIIQDIFKTKDTLITVGGSTLYAHGLWYGLDDMPEINQVDRDALWDTFKGEGLSPLVEELQKVDNHSYNTIDIQNPARVIRALEVFRSSGKPISYFRKQKKEIPQKSYDTVKICLKMDRELLYERINMRVDLMIEKGLLEEVRSILAKGISPNAQSLSSIGYREVVSYLSGEYSQERAIELIKRNSRRYAKRQLTFFRRYKDIHWFDSRNPEQIIAFVKTQLGHEET